MNKIDFPKPIDDTNTMNEKKLLALIARELSGIAVSDLSRAEKNISDYLCNENYLIKEQVGGCYPNDNYLELEMSKMTYEILNSKG